MLRIVVTFIALAVSVPSHGWEADTHYGLIKWLAVKAGFSLDDAELVAAGSQAPDESNVLAAPAVVGTFICLGRSVEASQHVQQYHFPSDGYVPGPQKDRAVSPGQYGSTNSGNRWVRQEIAIPMPGVDERTRLTRFGYSLHPLGDSWSHQGIPDRPDGCPKKLVWSHPDNRGGWKSHNADLTYLHQNEIMELAETTYEYMLEFLKKNPDLVDHAPRKWSALINRVNLFAEADTKKRKMAWFNDNKDVPAMSYTTYPCAIVDVNLPGRKPPPCDDGGESWWRRMMPDQGGKSKFIPDNVTKFYDSFLTNWIIRQQISSIVKEHVEVDRVLVELDKEYEGVSGSFKAASVETLFGMWLIEDHGYVNKLGHGQLNVPGHKELMLQSIEKIQFIKHESLAQAIRAPFGSQPYEVVPVTIDGEGSQYAAVFSFRHATRDTLIVVSDMVEDSRKITELFWVAL